MPAITRILVPVDFSEGSRAALDEAIFLAEKFDALIDLLHAWEPPVFAGADMVLVGTGDMRANMWETARRAAADELETWLHTLRGRGFSGARGLLVMGDAASSVVDHAPDYDLVVIGTHGRTGLSRLVLGSVAEKVVRKATCPVLCVRAQIPEAEKHPPV